jgi:superfamily II DNA helicase RecQ
MSTKRRDEAVLAHGLCGIVYCHKRDQCDRVAAQFADDGTRFVIPIVFAFPMFDKLSIG